VKQADFSERDIYVAALAHAIRLGKRPTAGQWMSGKISLDELNEKTGEAKRGEQVPIEFQVTQELLDAAAAMINAQEALFRARTTVIALNHKPVPEAVWDYARKVQKQ